MAEKPYVNATEAARILGKSVSTVTVWVDRGAFPGTTRFGRDYRIPRTEVERIKRDGLDFSKLEEAP